VGVPWAARRLQATRQFLAGNAADITGPGSDTHGHQSSDLSDLPSPSGRLSRLPALEPVGDSYCRRIGGASGDICARQRGVRIDLEGDSNQRENEDDNEGFHGPL
jgi:hypothetical protein